METYYSFMIASLIILPLTIGREIYIKQKRQGEIETWAVFATLTLISLLPIINIISTVCGICFFIQNNKGVK